ncbi:TPA: type VI secretion system-associated protein VasI [Pseudomonas aeruginosa]|uniref:type VI secretion system-associated protein VasI n=1 Tax=Pseudomonas aeruginosa TaxID=287 RepID=UPI000F54688F|nr:type VI secretion system-associated protein VasI [Pseudomonas aeruginosa]MBU8393861.1 type VI secretion system-associated protein TagO [Pseudomonas aeruginosa]RPM88002.1 type VI secretion system-associated protein TagO [Pseudomonas aeruginosa]RPS08916.1 type VI secretion system-associated protein TagO [Pseudomonas aeruginosa]HCE7029512.1 type VI secretion system-associated protein TagO [Pseudomonas aeruginosa]HCL3572612.1 type VI secretion system-associated protein TagO [Pseudomonas aerugin
MKLLSLTLLSAAALIGCDASGPAAAAGPDCTRIVSPIERLACFDAKARTPPVSPAMQPSSAPPMAVEPAVKAPDITMLVHSNEAGRRPEQTASMISRSNDDLPGQDKVVISAPALGGSTPSPYLAISCLSNISRLQLLTAEPLPVNRVRIRLLLDGRPISPTRPWQVLEDGTVTDAGRGLVAIEQLRYLVRPGQVLQLESDHSPFDGLRFDASALAGQMSQQREACHW